MGRITAGQDIDAHCSRCKLVLAHVIIAVDGTKVARVECKTCRTIHAYRAGRAGAAARDKNGGSSEGVVSKSKSSRSSATPRTSSAGGKRNTSKAKIATQNSYDQLMRGIDISHAEKYRATRSWTEGDVINHITFGLGLVTRVLSTEKVEVLFPSEAKILVHGRT